MTQAEFAKDIANRIHSLQREVEKSFYYLEADELNLQLAPNTWSILQCLEHINLTNEKYILAFRKAEEKASQANKANVPYKMSFLGKFLASSQKPKKGKIRFKMKTFDSLTPINQKDPKARLVEHVVFEKFNHDCQELSRLILAMEDYNWKSIKINSLLGSSLKLKLGDAFAFVVGHTERHIEQAMKINAKLR